MYQTTECVTGITTVRTSPTKTPPCVKTITSRKRHLASTSGNFLSFTASDNLSVFSVVH